MQEDVMSEKECDHDWEINGGNDPSAYGIHYRCSKCGATKFVPDTY